MKKIRAIANLSFSVACTLGAYLFFVCNANDDKEKSQHSNKSLFDKVKVTSHDINNNQANIVSDKILQKDNNSIELVNTTADISYNSSKGKVNAKSIIAKDDKCEMQSDITLELSDGLKITTDFADVDIKNKTAKADKKIFIDYKDAHISADSYDLSLSQIILSKNVKANQADKSLSCGKFIGKLTKQNDKYTLTEGKLEGKILYNSDEYNVSTDGVVIYKNDKIFFNNLTQINGLTNKKKFDISGNKITVSLSDKFQLKKAVFENNFTVNFDNNKITANSGTFENNIITAEGNVSIKSQHGVANCQKAVYNLSTGKLNMTNTGGVIFRKKNDAKI